MPAWWGIAGLLALYGLAVGVFIRWGKAHQQPWPLLEKSVASLLFVVLGAVAAGCSGAQGDGVYRTTMLVGLCFCCLGDVWLELHGGAKTFLAGLATFLLGHVWYLAAFVHQAGASIWDPVVYGVVLALVLAVQRPMGFHFGSMRIPALCYLIVITGMVVKAWSMLWTGRVAALPATLVAAGATLFFVSDGVLACNLFRKEQPWLRSINLASYYAGQCLLAISLVYLT